MDSKSSFMVDMLYFDADSYLQKLKGVMSPKQKEIPLQLECSTFLAQYAIRLNKKPYLCTY